ncbi:hypothetical protein [endosymbiont GvMRE of Glomus versiforme]|uniref:hypothetical protein n=1 Tax=endosymbiont GvMRE of Glomus versiforme TaxID=2039283 RepID=UPI000EDC3CF7|nr:hypothetical protein [endosymbiont GvMRE of Glomus versiforme]RHZ35582.1 hypothetical protein GvMRE_IIg334 [endosymbiont GvMRE of Glomus versiforme]
MFIERHNIYNGQFVEDKNPIQRLARLFGDKILPTICNLTSEFIKDLLMPQLISEARKELTTLADKPNNIDLQEVAKLIVLTTIELLKGLSVSQKNLSQWLCLT